jgi:uncharacterized membrane protein YcaP (DUF421 family)
MRGTAIYMFLFFCLRLLPRREVGGMGITDILVIVLIADAAQNGMSSDYKSVPEAFVLVSTILFWAHTIDWLDYKFPRLKLLSAPPLALIRHGRIVHENLAHEKITKDELMSQLRQNGVSGVSEVQNAFLEPDGRVSVIVRKSRAGSGKQWNANGTK